MSKKIVIIFSILCLSWLSIHAVLGDIGGYNINVDSPVVDINPVEFLKIRYRVINYGYIIQQDSLNGNIFGETLKNDFSFNHSHPSLIAFYYPVEIKERYMGFMIYQRLIGTSYLDLEQENANLYVYDYPNTLEMKLDLKLERDEITISRGIGWGFEIADKFYGALMIEQLKTESNRLFHGYAIDEAENYEYDYLNKTRIEAEGIMYSFGLGYYPDESSGFYLILNMISGMKCKITKELVGKYNPELPPIMAGFNYINTDEYEFKYPVRIKMAYQKTFENKKDSLRLELEIIPEYKNTGRLFMESPHLSSKYNEVKEWVISPKIRYTRTLIKNQMITLNSGVDLSYKKSPDPVPNDENGKSYSEEFISNSDLSINFYKLGMDVNILYKMFLLKIGFLDVYGTGKIRAYDIQSNKTAITNIQTNSFVIVLNVNMFF